MADVIRCDTCEMPILRTCTQCQGKGVKPGTTILCKCAGTGLEEIPTPGATETLERNER